MGLPSPFSFLDLFSVLSISKIRGVRLRTKLSPVGATCVYWTLNRLGFRRNAVRRSVAAPRRAAAKKSALFRSARPPPAGLHFGQFGGPYNQGMMPIGLHNRGKRLKDPQVNLPIL